MIIIVFLLHYICIYLYILPVACDKLPNTPHTLIKFVTPWSWPRYMAETCRSCV